MKEVWKDVPMYTGIYEASTFGRIRSKVTGKLAHSFKNEKGYVITKIFLNGQCKNERTHRLVALTFIPNPNNYPQVNHKDENRENNRVDNLEWCTCDYNNTYGSHSTAVEIDGKIFPSISKCAKYLGVPMSTLNNYLSGRYKLTEELTRRGLSYSKR